MQPLEFTIMGEPKPKGRGRAFVNKHTGKADVRTPQDTRDAEDTLAARAVQHAPRDPFDCPIHLDAIFVLPIPSSYPKWKREAAEAGYYFHTTRPDKDNLEKLLKDALSGLFWINDSHVFRGTQQKVYGAVPRTWVRIVPVEQMTKERWAEIKAQRAADG